MGKVATTAKYHLLPGLVALAAKINREHLAGERAARRSLEHFRAAGEMLLQAKRRVGHGRWLAWLKANVRFTVRRAQHYMELAMCEVTSHLEDKWRRHLVRLWLRARVECRRF